MIPRNTLAVCPRTCCRHANTTSPLLLPRHPTPTGPSQQPSSRIPSCHNQHHRHYATSSDPNHNTSDHNLPSWPTSSKPTPYDIFAISRTDPYTKRRFYQLVKLYHPDLEHHSSISSPLPASTRLDRYRLVIAANDLLSDPARRHAYDTHGLGWVHSPRGNTSRDIDRAWRSRPGNAAQNATWEDWERWYEARGEGQYRGPRQDPVYMPNSIFAMLIAMSIIVGAMVQGQRAETAGVHYAGVTAQRDNAVGREVQRSTEASAGLSKDERVGRFLRDRENVAFQFAPGRYEESQDEPD